MIDSIETRTLQAFRNHGDRNRAALGPVLEALQSGTISKRKAYECILRWLDGEDFRTDSPESAAWLEMTAPVVASSASAQASGLDEIVVHADGGSRGNPGPAAGAAVLLDRAGNVIAKTGTFLPKATNNYAEYVGCLQALELAAQHRAKCVEVRMDSELVVKQLQGLYRVRHPDMVTLHAAVNARLTQFESVRFTHVRRESNTHADEHVNAILDAAGS